MDFLVSRKYQAQNHHGGWVAVLQEPPKQAHLQIPQIINLKMGR